MKFLFLFYLFFSTVFCHGKGIYDTTIRPADAVQGNYVPQLKGKNIALVINQTSRVGNKSLLDIMLENGVAVKKIFVPEHGFRGKADAGAHIDNTTDSATGLPVISLYGSHKKPLPEDLADIDIVVYDLQDVGVRFYTYISTLQYVMEACAQNHKKVIILDRPNPNGFYVDGPVLDTAIRSFVGMQPIPIVYGMTAGEYAQMLAGEQWIANAADIDLVVIKCANYTHAKKYELPVAPSPNLRTMAAVYAYPALCLFEGTVVSVGRGTDWPFMQYGSPEFDKAVYPYSFIPKSGDGAKSPPYEGKVCYGEMVGKNAEAVLKTIDNSFYLDWVLRSFAAYPEKEKFFNSFFTKLSGTKELETQIKSGYPAAAIRASWHADLEKFKKVRKKYLLYKDF